MRQIEDFISPLVEGQFPAFYRDEGKMFVTFVKAYYEWAENNLQLLTLEDTTNFNKNDTVTQGNTTGKIIAVYSTYYMVQLDKLDQFRCNTLCNDLTLCTSSSGGSSYINTAESFNHEYLARKLVDIRDIDTTIEKFIVSFKNKYLPDIQFNTASNKRLFIKNALDFYRAKGTERAVDLFFKLIYGIEAGIYYPADDLLKASDNEFVNVQYLEIDPNETNVQLIGQTITGTITGSTAYADRLVRVKKNSRFIEVVYLENVSGNFQTGEDVRTYDLSTNVSARILGSLSSLTIVKNDEGYKLGDIIAFTDGDGRGGKLRVDSVVDKTGLVEFELINGGWGYSANASILGSESILLMNDLTNENKEWFYHQTAFKQFETIKQNLVSVNLANTNEDMSSFTVSSNVEIIDSVTNAVVYAGRVTKSSATGFVMDYDSFVPIAPTPYVWNKFNGNLDNDGSSSGSINITSGATPTYETGQDGVINSAFEYTSGDTLGFASSPTNNNSDFMWAVWFKQDGSAFGDTSAVIGTGYSNQLIHIGATAPNSTTPSLQIRHTVSGGWQTTVASTQPTWTDWNHYTLVKSGNNLYLYLNGLLVASDTLPGTQTYNNDLNLGLYNTGRVTGDFDDLKLYTTLPIPAGASSFNTDYIGDVNTLSLKNDTLSSEISTNTDISATANVIGVKDTFKIDYTIGANDAITVNETIYQLNDSDQEYASAKVSEIKTEPPLYQLTVTTNPGAGAFRTDRPIYSRSTAQSYAIEKISEFQVGVISINNIFYENANTYGVETGSYSNGRVFSYRTPANFTVSSRNNQVTYTNFYSNTIIGNITGYNTANLDVSTTYGGGAANIDYTATTGLTFEDVSIGSVEFIVQTTQGELYAKDPIFIIHEPKSYYLERYDYELKYSGVGQNFVVGETIEGNTGYAKAVITSHDLNTQTINATRITLPTSRGFQSISDDDPSTNDFVVGETFTSLETGLTVTLSYVNEFRNYPRTGLNANVTSEALSGNNFISTTTLIDSGFGYSDGETVNATLNRDPTVTSSFKLGLGKQGIAPGYFTSRRGFLSSDKYLHDNDFYQEYSYQVLTSLPFDTYRKVLVDVLHVSGTKPFGKYFSTTSSDIGASLDITVDIVRLTEMFVSFSLFENQNTFYTASIS